MAHSIRPRLPTDLKPRLRLVRGVTNGHYDPTQNYWRVEGLGIRSTSRVSGLLAYRNWAGAVRLKNPLIADDLRQMYGVVL